MTRAYIKTKPIDLDREKLSEYNREYYKRNKERLLMYQKIYASLHKEKNMDFLRDYYSKIEKNKRKNWDKAMYIPKSTRYKPPRKGMFDKGRKITGYEKKTGESVTVTFD
tara:strand:- start:968 stop:1297 length:330 start_codon:yes stop_codon:yes gene_type:complete